MAVTGSRIGAKADNINDTTLTRKPRPVGGELYFEKFLKYCELGSPLPIQIGRTRIYGARWGENSSTLDTKFSGDQGIDLGLFGPFAARIIPLKDLEPQFQLLRIMARLILGDSKIVLGLRGGIRFGITDQNLLKTLDPLFKSVKVEFCFTFSEDDLGNEILRGQISDKAMMLFAIRIQDDDGRSPFYGVAFHQSLVLVEIDLKGNEVFFY